MNTWIHCGADFKIIGFIKGLSDEEDAVSPDAAAFLKHALPAVPILVLGFIALEGRELVGDVSHASVLDRCDCTAQVDSHGQWKTKTTTALDSVILKLH